MVASLLFTFALACTPFDEFKIMCKARCNFDRDKSHWVTKGKTVPYVCHCGNPVTSEPNLVIPRNFKVDVLTSDSDE